MDSKKVEIHNIAEVKDYALSLWCSVESPQGLARTQIYLTPHRIGFARSLMSSQGMLLVQGLHFENHSYRVR